VPHLVDEIDQHVIIQNEYNATYELVKVFTSFRGMIPVQLNTDGASGGF
jgi:hypothetical protein